MCGRSARAYTWPELVALYGVALGKSNLQPRYNICPTTTVDTVVPLHGKPHLVPMRWGLIPAWWSKPLKELRLATFNARAETVAEKPFFRSSFKRKRCLIPATGYYEWHTEGKRKAARIILRAAMARQSLLQGYGTNGKIPKPKSRCYPAR